MNSFASKIFNTGDRIEKIPVTMLLYGNGGIGKTTFGSTAPAPLLADLEQGSKYFGMRGIRMPAADIKTWYDFAGPGQFVEFAISHPKIETIIVDPMDRLLELAKEAITGTKNKQNDGSLSMSGWGELKKMMITQVQKLTLSGKNIILVTHVEEKDDEGRMVKRPKIQTKLSEDLVDMVDIVGYMHATTDGEGKVNRKISVDPSNDKIVAKDRSGYLPKEIEPDFVLLQNALQEAYTKRMEISLETAPEAPMEPTEPAVEPPVVEPTEDKHAIAKAKLEAMND